MSKKAENAITLWYNPSCSKSRKALELLRAKGVQPKVLNYLEDTPNREMLEHVMRLLGCSPRELMRQKEPIYLELGLDGEKSHEELVEAMVSHPILIERPVAIQGDWATIGRPPERVLRIFS
jgi:arsenate reductase